MFEKGSFPRIIGAQLELMIQYFPLNRKSGIVYTSEGV